MPDLATQLISMPVGSLYVHVPFCAQKCVYCAFYSEASSGELINRYVAALVREMEIVADDLKPKTIFFGGGTPSLLNLHQWETILRAMEKLNLLGADEFTVECNPATVSADKAKLFRDFGINRISMGVQSLDEKLLDRLGRIHSREMVFKSFDILRRAGFENINLDLMFAIPTQDDGDLARDAERGDGDAERTSCPATKSFTKTTRRSTNSSRPANFPWTKIWPARCMRN
jgi:oxygen-independent coproporphyrinogen-3 oxidase